MIYRIDPLTDTRWAEFVERHPHSTIFHTPAWLSALNRTYGFEPLVLTTAPPGEPLANGVPFCLVRSALTGRRLVSLPFSDHCGPLASPEEFRLILDAALESYRSDRLSYVELRPLEPLPNGNGFGSSQQFIFHMLDLRPSIEAIMAECHTDCVLRKIRRAGREELVVESGRSDALLSDFYALQVITRRRHGYPPQPREWFKNLIDAVGENATVRVARASGRPVAAILTLRHKRTEVYKYGCSISEDHNLGGMQLLLWTAIEDAKAAGMMDMDLGRSGFEDTGLIQFKDRWGAQRRELAYYRYPATSRPTTSKSLFSKFPRPVLVLMGRLLYRHMA